MPPEISFGFIPNGGYSVGLNCVYIVAVSDIPLDKSYTISELVELYYSGKVILTYGGLSEFHRGHMMTEEVYNSYRCAQWCEGGCGGCEDNWDYIDPYSVYEIFPTHQDMKNYEQRCSWVYFFTSRYYSLSGVLLKRLSSDVDCGLMVKRYCIGLF